MSNSVKSAGPQAVHSDVLDAVSLQILEVLREDGRISIAALAERVGISRATAYSRVESMTASGIINGFSARIDAERVGLGIAALVFVTVDTQSWPAFRRQVMQLPDVEYCAVTTGEHDAMLLIRAEDISRIHDFTTGVIATLPPVRSVVSVVVLDEVVQRPYLLPSDLPERPASGKLGMTRWTPAAQGRDSLRRR